MTDRPEAEKLDPCPFCGASLSRYEDEVGEFFMHPGLVTDGDCMMSGKGVYPRNYAAWNLRAAAQPVADAGGDELLERFKRWLQNTGFDGGINSPPMLVLDRLQSVAAATAAKDAEIARLKGQFDRYFHEAADAQEQVEKLMGILRDLRDHDGWDGNFHAGKALDARAAGRAALSEAREAGALAIDGASS